MKEFTFTPFALDPAARETVAEVPNMQTTSSSADIKFSAGRHYFFTIAVTVPKVAMGDRDPGKPIQSFYEDMGFKNVMTVPLPEGQSLTIGHGPSNTGPGRPYAIGALEWGCLVEFDCVKNASIINLDDPQLRWSVVEVSDSGPARGSAAGTSFSLNKPDLSGLNAASFWTLTGTMFVASVAVGCVAAVFRRALGTQDA